VTRGLVIAAPNSGAGKTVVTLALLRALHNGGQAVGSLKFGPDYIDPGFHALASGGTCRNYDIWAMRDEVLAAQAIKAADNNALVIAEAVMGLFDGAIDGTGSSADAATRLGWPVVLVVDVKGQGASAAAVVSGFANYRDDVALAGVIFNRVGSPRHEAILRRAMATSPVPVLGCLPRADDLVIEDRHLGLLQAMELPDLNQKIDRAAALVERHIDLAALTALAAPLAETDPTLNTSPIPPLGQRIAIADDPAFSFRYPHILDGWREAGASLSYFSPLENEAPSDEADAIYLPGGYPELHARRLGSNTRFLDGLRQAAARKAVIWGECGGYMVLGKTITDRDGARHEMAGLLPVETSFAKRKLHLGYRKLRLCENGPLGEAGTEYHGHEFHYSTLTTGASARPLFRACDALDENNSPTGCRVGSVMGAYVHLIDRAG
jgi:cobyrinic acid a,c-diamide synthase